MDTYPACSTPHKDKRGVTQSPSKLHAHLFLTLPPELLHLPCTHNTHTTHTHTICLLYPLRLTHTSLVGGLLNSLLWQRIPVALSCSSDVWLRQDFSLSLPHFLSLSPAPVPSFCSSCLRSCSCASHSILLMKNSGEHVGCKTKQNLLKTRPFR